MTLVFPNPSRNFDEARRGIRFSGHDGMFEISFFVEAAVFAEHQQSQKTMSEQQYLSAFDAMRTAIQDVALRVYSSHHRNSNTLGTADFR